MAGWPPNPHYDTATRRNVKLGTKRTRKRNGVQQAALFGGTADSWAHTMLVIKTHERAPSKRSIYSCSSLLYTVIINSFGQILNSIEVSTDMESFLQVSNVLYSLKYY